MSKDFNTDKEDGKQEAAGIMSWEERLVSCVHDEWTRGYQYVDDLNDLFDDLYAMLRGERPEKNYDWQSNIVINKVFQVVWTTVPYIIQKVFGASPIVGVKGKDKNGAADREALAEFWHTFQPGVSTDHIPFKIVCIMWLLRACLNGVGIIKKTYRKTMKDGKPVEDWPVNIPVNNKDIVYDWNLQPGQPMRQGRFIIHRIMTDLEALHASPINYFNLDELVVTENTQNTDINQDHAEARQLNNLETPPDSDIYTDVEIYEREGIFPVYKKKIDDHWQPCFDKDVMYSDEVVFKEMITTVCLSQKKLVRFEPNLYGEKNYIDVHLYLDTERWHSMGQIEPIKDLQTGISDNINAAFDEIWQNLMPPAVVNKFALWDWDTMQYAPQQRWLVGGNPSDAIMWKEPSNITRDSWQKHMLLNNELDLTTSVTPPMQGMGKEKAATTNIMNAQMSAGKLDFLVGMFEMTGLIPSVQMDVRFAKKFANPLTFRRILGRPFMYSDITEEVYKYVPAAASVKLEHQKRIETTEDIQLIQIVASIPNPKTPAILNRILQNVFRNRDWEELAEMLDEDYFEPQGEAGNMQMINRMIGGEPNSNQNQVPMSGREKLTRNMANRLPQRTQ
ncbi:MAG: hypothetical protein GY774_35700 [Planctomycetes bacterium]|nr:hypothetical protein [Planctomycetota bacterium]